MDAGHKIAERLFGLKLDLFGESGNKDIVILAVPRGGIIIGDIVASELAARLDVVVSRKIGAPNNPELAIGAVMPDGSYFLNKEIVDILNVSQEYIDIQANTQIKEIDRRLLSYRGSKEYDNEFEDKIMVLVDDGIATGATIVASANWLKNKQRCRKLLIAVPVAPRSILKNLNQVADDVIVLYTPEDFMAVGAFYHDFAQISDDEVKQIMKRHGYNI
jgi:predicted phosphoribosyltransferase